MDWKVGLICACDIELQPFLHYISNRIISEKAKLKFIEGSIDGVQVAAVCSGVCKVNAAIASQILIDIYGVNAIINAGTAGGMDTRLDILDTVICTKTVYHDVDDKILTEYHPMMTSSFFCSDDLMLAMSKETIQKAENGRQVYWGRMATGEQFIDHERREEINAAYEPLSVDMESAGIAHVCYVNKIPFIAIRTITDTADHNGVDNFDKNCRIASEIAKDITLKLLSGIKDHKLRYNH